MNKKAIDSLFRGISYLLGMELLIISAWMGFTGEAFNINYFLIGGMIGSGFSIVYLWCLFFQHEEIISKLQRTSFKK